jgi:hypothetical protein
MVLQSPHKLHEVLMGEDSPKTIFPIYMYHNSIEESSLYTCTSPRSKTCTIFFIEKNTDTLQCNIMVQIQIKQIQDNVSKYVAN